MPHNFKKINDTIEENDKYLKNDIDNNNIFFSFKDIDILINYTGKGYSIRLYFENFDSSWDETAFTRSKRRFEKILKTNYYEKTINYIIFYSIILFFTM
jgi:ABC-type lipoprotein release transport system permease subunit